MIATGGLLRISSRRQDSLRSKTRAENKRKRKARRRKRKNDVVVVKGKLQLCSVSGLVAAVGVVIMLVGVAMAVLGYWPKENIVYPQAGPPLDPIDGQGYSLVPSGQSNQTSKPAYHISLDFADFSHSNGTVTESDPPLGFFADFLDRYLYSDKLKVLGPLIMGIGIFLFICANAVLHENRDRTTKIINLRDIYSTVIDIHSLRTKDCTPLNGFVNYVQSRGVDGRPGSSYTAAVLARSSWPSTMSGNQQEKGESSGPRHQSSTRKFSFSRDGQTFTDTVYSIYRDQNRTTDLAPAPKRWETRSIVTSSVNAFTLPVIKLNNCVLEEGRRSEEAAAEEDPRASAEVQVSGTHLSLTAAEDLESEASVGCALASTSAVDALGLLGPPQALQQGSQMQLLPPSPGRRLTGSHLSLSALSDYPTSAELGVSSAAVGSGRRDRTRRLSCPRLERSNSKGYIKLGDLGGESFESSDVADPGTVALGEGFTQGQGYLATEVPREHQSGGPQRADPEQYSSKERLLMLGQSESTTADGELEGSALPLS